MDRFRLRCVQHGRVLRIFLRFSGSGTVLRHSRNTYLDMRCFRLPPSPRPSYPGGILRYRVSMLWRRFPFWSFGIFRDVLIRSSAWSRIRLLKFRYPGPRYTFHHLYWCNCFPEAPLRWAAFGAWILCCWGCRFYFRHRFGHTGHRWVLLWRFLHPVYVEVIIETAVWSLIHCYGPGPVLFLYIPV